MEAPLIGREVELAALGGAITAGSSAVLVGGSGVGKTRLAREAARLACMRGRTIENVAGFAAARPLAFAAVARLLPDLQARDPHDLIRATVTHIRNTVASVPMLLVIDDAHLLDDGSATLINQLVVDGSVPCILTVNDSETCPDPVVALWKDGHAARVDVEPLDRSGTAALMSALLGGEAGVTLDAEVWRLTRGNPLFLRELIAAAEAGGHLAERDGIWIAIGPLPSSRRLANVVERRLAALDEEDRSAIELIAVGEPLQLSVAHGVVGWNRLERLEARGLLDIDQGLGIVRAAHPSYGEILRAAMPITRRASIAEELADRLVEVGPGPTDARMVAALLVDAGRDCPPALALQGARDALTAFDLALSERLARHALRAYPFDGHLLLGRALRLQGHAREAAEALAVAMSAARDDADVAEAALVAARNQLWAQGNLGMAKATLQTARRQIRDDAWCAVIEAELALQLATVGDFISARRLAGEALRRPGIGRRSELAALIVVTLGQALMLDTDDLEPNLARGLELANELRVEEPLAADQLLLAWAEAFRYDEPVTVASMAEERSRTGSVTHGIWRMAAAMVALLTGDIAKAIAASGESLMLLERVDPFGNLPMARGVYGVALGQAGQLAPSFALQSDVEAPAAQRELRARFWADRASAWQAAAGGDLVRAVEIAVPGGIGALEDGNIGWGCDLLHDAVRFGGAERVVDVLVETTATMAAPIARLYGSHASTLSGGDPEALELVGAAFADADVQLVAAEVHGQAATLWSRRERHAEAARTATRGQVLARRCPAAATPALSVLDDFGLSPRELQVAGLAAAGHMNRDIAGQLVVSLRTVENHLARVYRKLEMSGRDDLRGLFTV